MSNLTLIDKILFLNIGPYQRDNETYFQWMSNRYYKPSFFDVKLTRTTLFKDIFFCLIKKDLKLVYIVKDDVVFAIGAEADVQSPLLEALLEYLIEEFFFTYDKSLLMTCYGETCNIFDGFSSTIVQTLKNYNDIGLVETAYVTCKACNKTLSIVIKKSLIKNSKSPTVPIVYVHSGHSILVYVDKNFKVRGAEIVSIAY